MKDSKSSLLNFRIPLSPYQKAINYAIFSPTEYNCQILEKIIKPARPVFDTWWNKIETSKEIEKNRIAIRKYVDSLKPGDITLIGLLTDGGQGLATGNNGRFVAYKATSRFAERCRETRSAKLWNAISDTPEIRNEFKLLQDCKTEEDIKILLNGLDESQIWELFDKIKSNFGLRIFGKGYMASTKSRKSCVQVFRHQAATSDNPGTPEAIR